MPSPTFLTTRQGLLDGLRQFPTKWPFSPGNTGVLTAWCGTRCSTAVSEPSVRQSCTPEPSRHAQHRSRDRNLPQVFESRRGFEPAPVRPSPVLGGFRDLPCGRRPPGENIPGASAVPKCRRFVQEPHAHAFFLRSLTRLLTVVRQGPIFCNGDSTPDFRNRRAWMDDVWRLTSTPPGDRRQWRGLCVSGMAPWMPGHSESGAGYD